MTPPRHHPQDGGGTIGQADRQPTASSPRCIDRPSEREPARGGSSSASCSGQVRLRESLTGTGTPIPRCDRHWSQRLDLQRNLQARYPRQRPADFDPLDAGERWDEHDSWP
jgi:hypothetical protein